MVVNGTSQQSSSKYRNRKRGNDMAGMVGLPSIFNTGGV